LSIGRSFKGRSRAGRSVRLEPFDADDLALDAEQPLDGALRLHVASFADVVVIDAAVRVDEVERRQWWLSKALQIS
jgi:hypothetical protein